MAKGGWGAGAGVLGHILCSGRGSKESIARLWT